MTPRLELLEERTLLSGNLQLSLVAPPTAAPGASITYMISVTNIDSAAAADVSLTESLPSGVTYQSQSQTDGPSFTLSQSDNVVNDTIDSLAAGASATFSITGVVASDETVGAVLTDTAAATGSGAYSGFVPWSTTVQQSGSDGGSDSISRGSGSAGGASVSNLSKGGGVGFETASGSTSTSMSSNNPSVPYGTPVTFTADVSGQFTTNASQGYVTFYNTTGGNPGIAIGTASLAATTIQTTQEASLPPVVLPVAVYTYDATYTSNGSFLSSTSAPYKQTVTGTAATTTSLSQDVNPSSPNQLVTYTVTVAPVSGGGVPTGTVTFYVNGTTSLGSVTLPTGSSTATFPKTWTTAGIYKITATYSGSSVFATSTSARLPQTVTPSTYLNSSVNPSYPGEPVQFQAVVNGFNTTVSQGTVNLIRQPHPADRGARRRSWRRTRSPNSPRSPP